MAAFGRISGMETGEAPVRVSARFGDAPEADVHVMQENLSGLLVPILEELTDAREFTLSFIDSLHQADQHTPHDLHNTVLYTDNPITDVYIVP